MWAHVAAGVITAWGDLPSLWWDGARQWDLRDPANIAPAALLPVVAALVQSVIAFSHTTTSTPSGMPPGDEPVAPVDVAARLGLDDHQI